MDNKEAADFKAWLIRELPAGTEIGNPSWWADRIWKRAEAALRAQGEPVACCSTCNGEGVVPAHEPYSFRPMVCPECKGANTAPPPGRVSDARPYGCTLTDAQLADRLDELSDAVTKGEKGRHEFTMQVPAEPNRDADLVLSTAAQRLRLNAAPSGWQPATTAPKDGTEILVRVGSDGTYLVKWAAVSDFMTQDELENCELDDDEIEEPDWFYASYGGGGRYVEKFTHWMPLPAPPSEGGS